MVVKEKGQIEKGQLQMKKKVGNQYGEQSDDNEDCECNEYLKMKQFLMKASYFGKISSWRR